ncbi:mannose-6-phosphate isomerase, class I [Nonomuraea rubra]|uniref:mannose-6-phosphate isomerase, class I n=1 Tax=Nonomuraea rubra TaxID=46180 RepID=UPI00360FF2A2
MPHATPMRLATTIRPYDWGSVTALPELFGTEPTGEPQAELWMGAHPGAPSTAGGVPLNELIARDPAATLGERCAERFGPVLPYLLKVLAIKRPLSLQVHPTTAQAEAGYAAENARGIPLDDFARTYKDASHKPEMVCALTPFHGLCGFRSPGPPPACSTGSASPACAPGSRRCAPASPARRCAPCSPRCWTTPRGRCAPRPRRPCWSRRTPAWPPTPASPAPTPATPASWPPSC